MEPPMAWDAEDFKPPPIPSGMSNAWDGEDAEENVKANWDDDDDDKKRDDASKKQSQQSKKTTTRLLKKIEERERKELEERARKKKLELEEEVDYSDMTPEQIQAEKLRRQKLQEEADLELAKETLGITDDDSVDGMNPRSKEDFVVFKDALCKKVLLYKKSDNFPVFVEELFRDLSAGLAVNELRKIKLNLDNMLAEKSKTEKSKKARGKGKAKLRVDDNIIYDEYSAYTVDDYDDFM